MGMTMVEKILAAHCGKEKVSPGEIHNIKIDLVVGNEAPSVLTIQDFYRMECKKVFDREKVVIVPDHLTPNRGIEEAETCKFVREFARKMDIKHYFEVGQDSGISHVIIPEKGLVAAGDVAIGADSHTCTYGALSAFATGMGSTDMLSGIVLGEVWMRIPPTVKVVLSGKRPKNIVGKDLILHLIGKIGIEGARYKALEFTGSALETLSMDSRFCMANMSIEAGAKCGIFEPDTISETYLAQHCSRPYTFYKSDADADYDQIIEIDVSDLRPQVALPHLPENVVPIHDVAGKNIPLDQVFIGSCASGRLEDLCIAASIVKGKKVNKNLRLIVIPGSQRVYREALRAGYIDTLVESGAAVCTPTCGPCGGRNTGILASGERCASTSNRNFKGRMGHMQSEIYLVGPGAAAASAIAGYLTEPDGAEQGEK
jgi:3-isopropylmalate/(R)-2-methylmalate dehydratase large subunit